jgi:hypothetical protein
MSTPGITVTSVTRIILLTRLELTQGMRSQSKRPLYTRHV